MNLRNLSDIIINNMIFKKANKDNRIIKDYVFLMMLMGNDFMPHFPSLNIRTFGLQMLLDVYKTVINKRNLYLIDEDNRIIWKNVRELIGYFSSEEINNLKKEYKIRDKISKSMSQKIDSQENGLINIPILRELRMQLLLQIQHFV